MPKQRGWGPSWDLFLPYFFLSFDMTSSERSANSSIPSDSKLAMVDRPVKPFLPNAFALLSF